VTLGRHDPFRDVASWDADTAREWVTALDLRAASPDQVALRQLLLDKAALGPGDIAVEIGCGTGPLLVELATAVAPDGRVVGVEPQPALAEAARRRIEHGQLADVAAVRVGSADALPLPDAYATAVVAQTVLIHLPEEVLDAALGEMTRVTRPGGRVVSLDQDGDTWIVDHPDRELTRRIVTFNSDQRYADGWTGRRLPRLFRERGLGEVSVAVRTHVDTAAGSYLHGMAQRLCRAAVDAGVVTPVEGDRWIGDLDELATTGHFFSTINYYLCVGVRH
jgi:SAM-dependent methyltransferase